MLSFAVRTLFRRPSSHSLDKALGALASSVAEPEPKAEVAKATTGIRTAWPKARLTLVHQLWGKGFIFPGGEMETLRLTRALGVSAAASLLIIGVGSGGAASVMTRDLGAWVTGMDDDPSLLAAAKEFIAKSQLTKKVTLSAWDPENPVFDGKTYHHCLALEPFRGSHPEAIVHGMAGCLKPGGQIVITELVAPTPLDLADPAVRRWGELENRNPGNVLAPVAVTRMLGRVGLDVRIAEDLSQRHLEHAMLGWRVLLRELDRKPSRPEAIQLISEAELWLLRRRLMRAGRLQMMRWHAISRT